MACIRVIALMFLAGAAAGVHAELPAEAVRPAPWAERMAVEGVPNLHRITPTLYRSGQPSAAGLKNLEALGIRTVINLRATNSDEDKAAGTSLRLWRMKIYSWHVTDKQVIEVMRALRRTDDGPFLIHCNHGSDRTGLMSAMYRILEQHWSPDEALAEMTEGGYGFHSIWRNMPRYIRKTDPDELRAAID
jgi:protein tyrosine/serine phosphatase